MNPFVKYDDDQITLTQDLFLIPQTDNYLKNVAVIVFTLYQSCNLRGKRYAKQIQITTGIEERIHFSQILLLISITCPAEF